MTAMPDSQSGTFIDADELNRKKLILFDALISGSGLQGILDAAYTVFENPLIVSNSSYKVLAHVERPDCENTILNHIRQTGYYPDFYIEFSMKRIDLTTVFDCKKPIEILSDSFSPDRYITRAITLNNSIIGFATCVEIDKKFDAIDLTLFEVFCQTIMSELRSYDIAQQASVRQYEFFINDLISMNFSPDTLDATAKRFKLKNDGLISVLSFLFNDNKEPHKFQISHCKTTLENAVPHSRCAFYKGNIVMLLFQPAPPYSKAKLTEMLRPHMDTYGLHCGLSRCFAYLGDMSKFYKQSIVAAQMQTKMNLQENLTSYDSIAYYHMLHLMENTTDLMSLCSDKVIEVLNYDRAHSTSYIMDIYRFFRAKKNMSLAAMQQCVHRNTIDYRIKRIEDKFNLDFDDCKTVFDFEMLFLVMVFEGELPFDY